MTPSPSRVDGMLFESLARVAETSFFAIVDAAGDVPPPAPLAWFVTAVRFTGPFEGQVTMALPVPLALGSLPSDWFAFR